MFSVERDFTTAVNDIFDAYRLQEQVCLRQNLIFEQNQNVWHMGISLKIGSKAHLDRKQSLRTTLHAKLKRPWENAKLVHIYMNLA